MTTRSFIIGKLYKTMERMTLGGRREAKQQLARLRLTNIAGRLLRTRCSYTE